MLITILDQHGDVPAQSRRACGRCRKCRRSAPEVESDSGSLQKVFDERSAKKREMNKEVMEGYSREGINPLGSCWPTLIQMPIWFGLYRMLANYLIELRHAVWMGWIHDLSAHDPYYILPVIMAASMFFMQKMTPTPGMDPAQAKMLGLMPLIFGAWMSRSLFAERPGVVYTYEQRRGHRSAVVFVTHNAAVAKEVARPGSEKIGPARRKLTFRFAGVNCRNY